MPGAEPRSRTAAARSWTGLAGAFLRELEPLWAAGLALLAAALGLLVLPLTGEPRETALWLLAGALLLPAAAIGARLPGPAAGAARRGLGAAALVAAGVLAVALRDPAVIALGGLQAALVLLVARRQAGPPWAVVPGAILGWAVAAPLVWWMPLHEWLTRDLYDVAIAMVGVYLVVAKLFRSELRAGAPPRWEPRTGLAAAVLLLGYASLHTDPLFEPTSAYHWSFYVGPALLIRQGAVPLWDVPAQYGLLSELAIAWLPGSPWAATYALNAALNLVYALALFVLLRAPMGDLLDQVASLLLAFFLVFGRVAFQASFAAVQVFPSTGGMRFAWSLLLLLTAVQAASRAAAGRPVTRLLVAGSAIWLAGCLWSLESAVYCSLTWLPAMVLLAGPSRRRLLAVPPALAAVSAAALLCWLGVRLGHPPDPRGFFEYAVSYGGGFGSLPIDPAGPVWVVVLAVGLVAAALGGRRAGADAGLVAAAGLLWATASYFVSRSHPSQVTNLGPLLVSGLLLATRLPGRPRVLPRQAAAAVVAAFLVGPLAYELGIRNYVVRTPQPARVDALRPRADPFLQALIDRAGLRPGDPVVFVGSEQVPALPPVWRGPDGREVTESRLWLPLAPAEELGGLPVERRLTYLERFRRSSPGGGWVLEADRPDFDVSWLDGWLSQRYRPVETLTGSGWRLTRYQPR